MARSGLRVGVVVGLLASLAACDESDPQRPIDGAPEAGSAPRDGGSDAGRDELDAGSQPGGDAGSPGAVQAVQIRFKPKVGGQELVCGQTYGGLGSGRHSATPRDFRLLVQEIRLIARGGAEVPVKFDVRAPFQNEQVALLDFTTGAGGCDQGASTTNMVIYGTVPPGDYDGLVLVNGVPEALNHGDPTVAPAPLQAPGLHWTWQSGYRFITASLALAEGAQPLDGGVLDGGHASGGHGGEDGGQGGGHGSGGHGGGAGASEVHVGSTGCTGTVASGFSCERARPNRTRVQLSRFDAATQSVVVDLGALFAAVDLGQGAQCHGSGPACVAPFTALGIDYETGAPIANQTTFSVE